MSNAAASLWSGPRQMRAFSPAPLATGADVADPEPVRELLEAENDSLDVAPEPRDSIRWAANIATSRACAASPEFLDRKPGQAWRRAGPG